MGLRPCTSHSWARGWTWRPGDIRQCVNFAISDKSRSKDKSSARSSCVRRWTSSKLFLGTSPTFLTNNSLYVMSWTSAEMLLDFSGSKPTVNGDRQVEWHSVMWQVCWTTVLPTRRNLSQSEWSLGEGLDSLIIRDISSARGWSKVTESDSHSCLFPFPFLFLPELGWHNCTCHLRACRTDTCYIDAAHVLCSSLYSLRARPGSVGRWRESPGVEIGISRLDEGNARCTSGGFWTTCGDSHWMVAGFFHWIKIVFAVLFFFFG